LTKAKNLADGERWRDVLKIVIGSGSDGLLAKFEAELTKVAPSLPPAFNPMALSQARLQLHSLACKAYVKGNNINGMKKHCPVVVSSTQIGGDNDEWAIVGLGEIAMKEERWEEAVRHFRNAFEKGGRNSQDVSCHSASSLLCRILMTTLIQVLNRLQKAERTLKVSKQKDYYKILGVSRDADTKTIKKAL
jgi:DnaJ family protein C protein 3